MDKILKIQGLVEVKETREMAEYFMENLNNYDKLYNKYQELVESVKNNKSYDGKYYLIWRKEMLKEMIHSAIRSNKL